MSMAELAKANKIEAVLASVLPVCDSLKPQTARRAPDKISALNSWIQDYTSKSGAVYLDYFKAMAGADGMLKSELTYDCLHPNDAGYAVMVPLAQKAIEAALGKKEDQ
jgi:lysophospholipase L1-like esterase